MSPRSKREYIWLKSHLRHNFFCPSMKLIAKERIGSKTIKHHDAPKTPYQRIMASLHVHPTIKHSLSKQLEPLNPFVLRETMEQKLKTIFNCCTPRHPTPTIPQG